MAGEGELATLLGTSDLLNFSNTVRQSDPYGIAGSALSQWKPNNSTWSPATSGLTAFGQSFLSGLLGNYANQRTSDQLGSVINVLPQLGDDPFSVATPQGVDSSAFNVLKGSAILKGAQREALNKSAGSENMSDLLKTVLGEGVKSGLVSPQDALTAVSTGKLPANLEGSLTGKENPNSPQYKADKDKEERLITIRKEFNGLPPVQNFAKASQAANALAGALKDKSKVSDQELVRYSILMIEPGMAVREGEQGAVANSQSIPEAWRGQLKGALSGQSTLGDDVREGIKNLASRAYTSHKSLYDQANELYSKEATMQGLDPSRLSYIGNAPGAESIFGVTPKVVAPETKAQIQSEYLTLKSQIGADAAKAQIAAKYPELK